MAVAAFVVLLLLCTMTRALVDEYMPLDKCNFCGQQCPGLCEEAETANVVTCACDASCTTYGDCCYTAPNCPTNNPAPELPGLQCLKIRSGGEEAYWMITECFLDWLDSQAGDGTLANEMCINPITGVGTYL